MILLSTVGFQDWEIKREAFEKKKKKKKKERKKKKKTLNVIPFSLLAHGQLSWRCEALVVRSPDSL